MDTGNWIAITLGGMSLIGLPILFGVVRKLIFDAKKETASSLEIDQLKDNLKDLNLKVDLLQSNMTHTVVMESDIATIKREIQGLRDHYHDRISPDMRTMSSQIASLTTMMEMLVRGKSQ